MKIVQINSVFASGSTGKIVRDLDKVMKKSGFESYIAYGCGKHNEQNAYCMESRFYQKLNILKTRIFGKHGFYNKSATKKLIKWLNKVDPDIIHLHNIHGHYINIEILFNYLKKSKKKIVWTLHDCWAFTGHCSYFDYINCDKWLTGCYKCPQKRSYPDSWLFDRSKESWRDKRRLFTSIDEKNMIIVTPSKWLSELVERSYLKQFPVYVINNGIDLDVFRPVESNFRFKYNLQDKFIVLGVSMGFCKRKGIDYFIQLSEILSEDFQIVLFGVNEAIKKRIPNNIIAFEKTNDLKELIEIYTSADVLVNPTLEDNFPTINLEALACGTPVITFNTGGSVESIDESCGMIVEKGNVHQLAEAINKIKLQKINSQMCIERAKIFSKDKKFLEYINLYNKEVLS